MKKIMKKVLSLALVVALAIAPMTAMAATGDYAEPYELSVSTSPMQPALSVSVEAGATKYIQAANCNGTEVNVGYATGDYMLQYGRQTIYPNPDEDKTASFTMQQFGGALFSVYNPGNDDIQVYFKLYPGVAQTGTMDNPEKLELEVNPRTGALGKFVMKDLEAGNEGYWYSITAPGDGVISVSVNADGGWFYHADNKTANRVGDNHWSDDDEVVDTEKVNVSVGDEVVVFVATYDPNNMFANPMGTVYVTCGFAEVGTNDCPKEITAGTQTEAIKDGSQGFFYTWTATDAGKVTVAMDTDSNSNGWQYNVTNITTSVATETHVSSESPAVATEVIDVVAGDELKIMVNTFDPNNVWSAPAGTVKWTLSFEADSTGGQGGSGNQGGSGGQGGSGNQGGDEAVYYISNTVLQLGENNSLQLEGLCATEWTLFEFTPSETGVYKLQADDGVIGYWGATTNYVVEPNIDDCEGFVDKEVTAVGQSIVVGVTSVYGDDTVGITITRIGDAEIKKIDWTTYKNTIKPTEYKYNGDVDKLLETYVDTTDKVVDKAVLGKDGYYHLNSEDGEILYVNLNDSLMSLVNIVSKSKLSAVYYDKDGKVTEAIDFTTAILEYLGVKDIAELEAKNFGTNPVIYPLTTDLMTMFQKVGETNDWYGANGFIQGTEAEDAWMFACYYVKGQTTSSTPAPGTTPTESPKMGDNANVAVWAIVMVVAAGAAFVVAESKRRAR